MKRIDDGPLFFMNKYPIHRNTMQLVLIRNLPTGQSSTLIKNLEFHPVTILADPGNLPPKEKLPPQTTVIEMPQGAKQWFAFYRTQWPRFKDTCWQEIRWFDGEGLPYHEIFFWLALYSLKWERAWRLTDKETITLTKPIVGRKVFWNLCRWPFHTFLKLIILPIAISVGFLIFLLTSMKRGKSLLR